MSSGLTRGVGRIAAIPALLLTMGCADDDSNNTDGTSGASSQGVDEDSAAGFEGIYRMTAHSKNQVGRSELGRDVLSEAEETYVALTFQAGPVDYVKAMSCSSEPDCRSQPQSVSGDDVGVGTELPLALTDVASGGGLEGFWANSGYLERRYVQRAIFRKLPVYPHGFCRANRVRSNPA